ncbi:hypothetical protein GCM10011313_12390 [Mycetocola zhadangensis]|nr:hypothetical protein GCM10011313_12390 [Mycetocola zhadangensis]
MFFENNRTKHQQEDAVLHEYSLGRIVRDDLSGRPHYHYAQNDHRNAKDEHADPGTSPILDRLGHLSPLHFK